MPRASKGPYLWKRPGRNGRSPLWIIKDGDKQVSTGCVATATAQRPPEDAVKALAKYIDDKYKPERKARDVDFIDIADVLAIYYEDRVDSFETEVYRRRFTSSIERLTRFFGGTMLGKLNSKLCDKYVKSRKTPGGARRDLENLRAAIGHHAKENLHHAVIHVKLPPKGQPRQRWLTRDEAAKLIWTCWTYRETQTVHRGPRKGEKVQTDKRPLRHIARFILIGLYTGTRASAIAAASPTQADGRSYVDLEAGIFYRLAVGKRVTNKRQPPVRLPDRLLAHMRRWKDKKLIANHFVEFQGAGVASVKVGFKRAVSLAKLSTKTGNITPHTLRHTAATWLMQRGADMWQAAGFLGMSVQVLMDTYGHHHPDFMKGAADAITRKDRVQPGSGNRSGNPEVSSVA